MLGASHSQTLRAIHALIAISLFALPAHAKYSGGTGEPNDPYQIATAADLIALGETPEDYDKHFILTADIDLDPNLPGRKVFDKGVVGSGALSGGESFTGVFQGRGHTISHLTIKGGPCLGLFGQLGSGAEVRDLGVVHISISGSSDYVGGLVGLSDGTITQCYSTGTVTGSRGVGALVGAQYGGTVARCYSTGAVSGTSGVAGLVGHNYAGYVAQCYSTGAVGGREEAGGLVGFNGGAVFDSVWDMESSGQSASAGGVGLTTAEMMNPYMLGLNGFADDPNWVVDAGRDYPRLAWEGTPGQVVTRPDIDWLEGSGTSDDPYRIDTAEQLVLLGRASVLCDRHFILEADIDLCRDRLGVDVFPRAVVPYFAGVFDGDGHTISHLTIEGAGPLGLFGHVGSGGKVQDLEMADVNIVASGYYVGGLAGRNDGTVIRCYSTGTVCGSASVVGGLLGNNEGTVTHCHTIATVSGAAEIGGLLGADWHGDVTQCHSAGSVSGKEHVGGLVGWAYGGGTITSCDSSATVSAGAPDGRCFGGLAGSNGGDLTDCYSTGTASGGSEVGGLAGSNSGAVTRCDSTGDVTGNYCVGGLVGRSPAPFKGLSGAIIAASHSSGAVEGWSSVGGLVGSNEDGSIATSYSTGEVSGGWAVGGLVGGNHWDVRQCYSTGAVRGDGSVGGLVGRNSSGNIATCCSTGPVRGDQHVGGLVGYNEWGGSIVTSYCSGPVHGTRYVGGLVGYHEGWGDGIVAQCYSSGAVSGGSLVGGLVGWSTVSSVITECLWDIEASGQVKSASGIGKTTAGMQTAQTFLEAGWDFVGETPNGTADIWWILEEKDYPRFAWEEGLARVRFPKDADLDVPLAPILRWAPGGQGLQHDVYFGVDAVAVANATVETGGVYRGRQPFERVTYDPGPLEWDKTYYWRVDEVNEADPNSSWKGSVWTFTTFETPVVVIVDDFESYTDDQKSGQAVFQTWLDGYGYGSDPNDPNDPPPYGGNGTGSGVGYFDPPFAEQEIVRTGRQSMPMDYNNVNEPWYSEAERTWATPQDWTTGGAETLTLYFHGNPVAYRETHGVVTMSGWGELYPLNDNCRFALRQLDGDGSITAKVAILGGMNSWAAQAGLMIRENLNPDSKRTCVAWSPTEGVSFGARFFAVPWGTTDDTVRSKQTHPWVKLTRAGDVFVAQCSADGATWTDVKDVDGRVASTKIAMTGTVCIGLWVTSGNYHSVATAVFSDIATTGDVTGEWQVASIGDRPQGGNAPQDLYVRIEDSSGKQATVVHADAEAVLATEWQKWHIALGEVRAAGVDVAAVKKMMIGVGDRSDPSTPLGAGPQPGGTGRIYIDDIRLTKRMP